MPPRAAAGLAAQAVVGRAEVGSPLITAGSARPARTAARSTRDAPPSPPARKSRTSTPDVSGHVVEAVAVRREAPTGEVPSKPSTYRSSQGNRPCHVLLPAFRPDARRPTRTRLLEATRAAYSHSASVGSLCWPTRRRPLRPQGDLDDRMAVAPRARPARAPPVRARNVTPTSCGVVERRGPGALGKTSDPEPAARDRRPGTRPGRAAARRP